MSALTTQLETALRAAVLSTGQIYKDLFYPDGGVAVSQSALDIVGIQFDYEPQGFTSTMPKTVINDNAQVTKTNLNLSSVTNGVIMRSRQEINDGNVAIISKEVASGFDALHAILPYANGAGTSDYNGTFTVEKMVTAPRVQHVGLSNSSGLAVGRWLLPSANPYSQGGSQYRFDNYTHTGGTNHGYDWVVVLTAGTYYLKATTELEFGVNLTDKVIDPAAYDQTWTVTEDPDGNLGTSIETGAVTLLPATDTLINRAGENTYDIWVNTNSRVQVRYNGTLPIHSSPMETV